MGSGESQIQAVVNRMAQLDRQAGGGVQELSRWRPIDSQGEEIRDGLLDIGHFHLVTP